jgi:RNA polymerase sigma factor (sigma-70 family)
MDEKQWLVGRFEERRPQLRAVAYRMLGSLADADDAVQDAWERVNRAGADDVENLNAWLTTIVARICLNTLRSRSTRREDAAEVVVPDPVVAMDDQVLPEDEAIMADSVGLALQVVLDTLSPAERLAFVLHDMFDLPFEEIGPLMGRTTQATGNSRAERAAGFEMPRALLQNATSQGSERSSKPSSLPVVPGTSARSLRSCIPMSCSEPTSAPADRGGRRSFGAPRPLPEQPEWEPGPLRKCFPPS